MATISGSRGAPTQTQDTASTHPYTCNTCQVAFRNSDLQKGHMRSDWHRYNLKRRVASLPPIASETFTEKVLQARATSSIAVERTSFQKDCDVCHRTYNSENSYQNHLSSQKHKVKEAAHLRRGQNGAPVILDDASSMISSTFSLGEPIPSNKSDADSDAEEKLSHILEGMKSTGLQERTSNSQAAMTDGEDHQMGESSSDQPSTSETPTPPKIAVSINACLFCNTESADLATNVAHMERTHGMFVPEKQYLVDLEGLIKSLQQRVHEFNQCLLCGREKVNAFAVQTHMRDTGHCSIPYTTEDEKLEIGEFYDFRSTYSDGEYDSDDESETNGGARLGGKRATTTTNEDGETVKDGEDEGWETDSEASSLDSDDLHAVTGENHYHQYERLDKHPHHSTHDTRPHRQPDGSFHARSHNPVRAAFYDEYELHLSNGRSVGHRQHRKYFRQHLVDRDSPAERIRQHQLAIEIGSDAMDVDGEDVHRGQLMGPRFGSNGRQVRDQKTQVVTRGEGGMHGVSAPKRKEVQKAIIRGRKAENAAQRRHEWEVGKKANNQKYFHYSIL